MINMALYLPFPPTLCTIKGYSMHWGMYIESDSTIALFGNDNDTGPWSRSPTYSFKSVGEPDYPSPIHLQSDTISIK